MSLHLILWIIAAVVAGVATFLTPARHNLVAASLCFGFAGFVAQAAGA